MNPSRTWSCISLASAVTLSACPTATLAVQPATTYLCVADSATGFAFSPSKKVWSPSQFHVDQKYVISRSKREGVAWEVKSVGEESVPMLCQQDFSSAQLLLCQGFGKEFRFNAKLLRFLYSYEFGYWDEGALKELSGPEGSNTPALVIGRCSML